MDNEKNIKNNSPEKGNSSSKNVMTKDLDPESFPDPISIEKEGETASEVADNEQKFKEALTERD